MIQAEHFVQPALERGYSFWSGVPCSFLTPFINYVIGSPDLDYIGATSEGEALGIAAGAHLAGRKTVVICQNSGLGNAVNPLTSLNYTFRIPTLFITTHRGAPGIADEPQHELMGQITGELLDTMRIPWEPFPTEANAIVPALERAEAAMAETGRPYAFVMAKGTVDAYPLRERPELRAPDPVAAQGTFTRGKKDRMPRLDAIRIVHDAVGDDTALLGTTGKIGRELYTLGHRPNQLYVVGSMGCASGIALGVHLGADGRRPVVVLDGDGAALMKMGTLATIGYGGSAPIRPRHHRQRGPRVDRRPGHRFGRHRLRHHRRRLRLSQRVARGHARGARSGHGRRHALRGPQPGARQGRDRLGRRPRPARLGTGRGEAAVHGLVRKLNDRPMQSFQNPVRIRFGWGAVDAVGDAVGDRRCAVITTEGMARRGTLTRMEDALGRRLSAAFTGVEPNPTSLRPRVQLRRWGRTTRRSWSPSAAAASIDTAKAVAAQRAHASSPGWLARHLRDAEPFASEFAPPPIIAIPTTAGTGSEVTMWGTIWDEQTAGKHSISHPALYPETALLDPELTLSVPRGTTVASALDALSHAMEAIWNRAANPVSDALAVRRHRPHSRRRSDPSSRRPSDHGRARGAPVRRRCWPAWRSAAPGPRWPTRSRTRSPPSWGSRTASPAASRCRSCSWPLPKRLPDRAGLIVEALGQRFSGRAAADELRTCSPNRHGGSRTTATSRHLCAARP